MNDERINPYAPSRVEAAGDARVGGPRKLPAWRYAPAAPLFLAGILMSGVGVGLLLRMFEFFHRAVQPSVESYASGGLLLAAGTVWLRSAKMFIRERWRPAIAWAFAVPMGLIGLLAFSLLYELLIIRHS